MPFVSMTYQEFRAAHGRIQMAVVGADMFLVYALPDGRRVRLVPSAPIDDEDQ